MSFLPTYIDPETWAAFVESRKAHKAPFTPLAEKLVIRKLMKMHADGWDVNASLEKSAIYGYRGIFPVDKIKREPDDVDPALAKIKRDAAMAKPMPAQIREQLDMLRRG